MGVTQSIQHKASNGKLFDDVEDALEYDASLLKCEAAALALGKMPERGYKVRVPSKELTHAIKVFKEECEHWFPNATEKIFNPDLARTFHESVIGRYVSDNDTPLDRLCFKLCCIDTEGLLMYQQINAKRHPAGVKFKGEENATP